MRKRKAVVEAPKLPKDLEIFRKTALENTVSEDTSEVYLDRYQTVLEFKKPGDGGHKDQVMYSTLLRFLKDHRQTCVASKRQYKSAVLHVLHTKGWSIDRSLQEDLDWVLDGMEIKEARSVPKRMALNGTQLDMVVQHARLLGYKHTADFMEVMLSVCCRPQDADIEGWRIDLPEHPALQDPSTVFWARRKGCALQKLRLGQWEPHMFYEQRGLDVIAERKRILGDGPLFGNPTEIQRLMSEVVQTVAEREQWPGLITGGHNVRHGAAEKAFAEAYAGAIAAARERGTWRTDASARRYGDTLRHQPKAPGTQAQGRKRPRD